jgi:hypothetical protein
LGGVDIHAENDFAFRCSFTNGHLELAQWLWSLGDVDMHGENDTVFWLTCNNNYLETAQWFWSLGGVDIHAGNDFALQLALRLACMRNHVEMVRWLMSLDSSPSLWCLSLLRTWSPIRDVWARGDDKWSKHEARPDP